MGQMLISCGEKMEGIEVVAEVDQGDDLGAIIGDCDVVIDFSLHGATGSCAAICATEELTENISKNITKSTSC